MTKIGRCKIGRILFSK